MVELISSILFIGSTAGAITIVAKKMPAANQLPGIISDSHVGGVLSVINSWLTSKIRKTPYFKDFSWLDFAQKALLKGKLVALKTENKINDYIVKLRKRADEEQKKEEAMLDNYWHDLRTMVKTRKPIIVIKNSKSPKVEEEVSEPMEAVAIKTESVRLGELKLSEPMIGKVVMPEDVIQKTSNQCKKKRSSNSKKKRFRDPFSW